MNWIAIGTLAITPQILSAQADHSGYAGHQHREIKALSAEDTAALLAGEGSGMALPAELNGYPGPRHVLDFGPDLGLNPEQRRAVEQVYDGMHERAVELGRLIVELERRLDAHFAQGGAGADSVARLAGEIGARRGELRATHLVAHLETARILTDAQRARYAELRGYGGPDR